MKNISNKTKLIIGLSILVILAVMIYKSSSKVQEASKNWKTYNDPTQALTYKYPDKLGTKYIDPVDWPPKAQIVDEPFTCTEAGSENSPAGLTAKDNIGGREYCVTKETEGAAGSLYTQYAYGTEINKKMVFLTFALRFVQCGNYDDPQKSECEAERSSFNIDPTIDQLVKTISF